MSPDDFLRKVPPVMTDYETVKKFNPKLTRKDYEKLKEQEEDTTFYEKKVRAGKEITPPQIFIGSKENDWTSHEGRHRALLAKKLGETEMPVAVYWWGGHRGDPMAEKILADVPYSRQGSSWLGWSNDEVTEFIENKKTPKDIGETISI